MKGKAELPSLNLEDSNYLYQIRGNDYIIYISVCPKLITKTDRMNGSKVLAQLKKASGCGCLIGPQDQA
jgi:hypothetical protein